MDRNFNRDKCRLSMIIQFVAEAYSTGEIPTIEGYSWEQTVDYVEDMGGVLADEAMEFGASFGNWYGIIQDAVKEFVSAFKERGFLLDECALQRSFQSILRRRIGVDVADYPTLKLGLEDLKAILSSLSSSTAVTQDSVLAFKKLSDYRDRVNLFVDYGVDDSKQYESVGKEENLWR